jgi:thioredoxin-like negative regulator of GroEL
MLIGAARVKWWHQFLKSCKRNIYKVNTEEQQELAGMFGIQSIPSILFVPSEGQPQMALGALPKETFRSAINDVLKVSIN